MADKFAGDDVEIRDQRHKGKRIGTLWLKKSEITGDVTLTEDFLERDALECADVLKDVIGVLQREYNNTVDGMWSGKRKIT